MKYSTSYWTNRLDASDGDLPDNPTAKLLGWIEEESGGKPSELGSRFEVGIFQINLVDGPAYGGTLDTLHGNFSASPTSTTMTRELTDDEEQLQVDTGLTMIRSVFSRSDAMLAKLGLSWSDDERWCLVKLWHALPRLWDQYLGKAAAAGAASSWSDARAWITSLSRDDAAAINAAVTARYYPFDKYFDNAERVGFAGGVNAPVGAIDVGLLLLLAAAALLLTRYIA